VGSVARQHFSSLLPEFAAETAVNDEAVGRAEYEQEVGPLTKVQVQNSVDLQVDRLQDV